MLEAAVRGDLTALYLIGVDPARDFEDPALAEQALERVDTLIVQDLLPTASTRHADVVFAAAAPQERVGSFTTWEGRRQPFPAALPAQGLAQEDWDIIRQLARGLGTDFGWETATDVRREAAALMEAAGPSLTNAARPADPGGPVQQEAQVSAERAEFDVVVLDHLIGRGSMLVGATALLDTARTPSVWVHPDDAVGASVSEGDRVAVVAEGGRVELPVRITSAVAPGVIVVPRNSTDEPVALDGRVRLETLVPAGAEG
jgi:NADH-quinone oxidoreductase subunit G